jgi:hypothetical protein
MYESEQLVVHCLELDNTFFLGYVVCRSGDRSLQLFRCLYRTISWKFAEEVEFGALVT